MVKVIAKVSCGGGETTVVCHVEPLTVNLSQSLVPVFNGENYGFWSIKMKTIFISQDLWDLVENGYTDAEKSSEVKELRKKDAKALLVLQQAVTDTIFPRIANATKSKEAWVTLR